MPQEKNTLYKNLSGQFSLSKEERKEARHPESERIFKDMGERYNPVELLDIILDLRHLFGQKLLEEIKEMQDEIEDRNERIAKYEAIRPEL